MDCVDRDYEMDHHVHDLDMVEVENIPGMSSVGPSTGSDGSESMAVLCLQNEQPEVGLEPHFESIQYVMLISTAYWLFRFAPFKLHNLPCTMMRMKLAEDSDDEIDDDRVYGPPEGIQLPVSSCPASTTTRPSESNLLLSLILFLLLNHPPNSREAHLFTFWKL